MNFKEDCNDFLAFDKLPDDKKDVLCSWIREHITSRKTLNLNHSSYNLKHIFENSPHGFYTTNGEFKGAMLKMSFKPNDMRDINWVFPINYNGTHI
jgi:hypothetical protein